MIAGKVRPWRQSSGTQNKSPSVPRTQPLESSIFVGIGRPESEFKGRWSLDRLLDPEKILRPSGENKSK